MTLSSDTEGRRPTADIEARLRADSRQHLQVSRSLGNPNDIKRERDTAVALRRVADRLRDLETVAKAAEECEAGISPPKRATVRALRRALSKLIRQKGGPR